MSKKSNIITSMKDTIYLKDKNSGQILKSFPASKLELAFQQAKELEEFGLDIELIIPTVLQGLAHSLGLSESQTGQLAQSVSTELGEHDGYCCMKNKQDAP